MRRSLLVLLASLLASPALAGDLGTLHVDRPKPGLHPIVWLAAPPMPAFDPAALPAPAREPFARWTSADPAARRAAAIPLEAALAADEDPGPEAAATLGAVRRELALDALDAAERTYGDCLAALPVSAVNGRPIGEDRCGPAPALDHRPAIEAWRRVPAGSPLSAWAADVSGVLLADANLERLAEAAYRAALSAPGASDAVRADAAWRLGTVLGPRDPASIEAFDEAIRLGDPAVRAAAGYDRVSALFWVGRVDLAVRAALSLMPTAPEGTTDDLAELAGLGLAVLGPDAPGAAAAGPVPTAGAAALVHAAAILDNYGAATWARADLAAARALDPAVPGVPPSTKATPADRVRWAVQRCLYLAPGEGYAEIDVELSRDRATARPATSPIAACLAGSAVPPPETPDAARVAAHVIVHG